MARGTIKGTAFREFVVWVEAQRGAGALRAALEGLPPALAGELDPERPALGVLASSRYDVALVHALLDALVRELPEREVEVLVGGAARATILGMMHGLQKAAFALLVSPARYPRIINVLWKLNYDSGRVEVTVHGPRCHEGVVTGWAGHHPLVCRINHQAKLTMYEVMGCRNVQVRQTACVSRGDADCRSTVTWT
ncbi:MAG: hypothetical protein IT376_18195 [Polyangiaceae bacterium]|nr:hypothetical protein [Polyangiaceae bacterium]